MDFHKIEAFLAVVEHGNLSDAANALFISQPSLSYRISSLEDELGKKLFERHKGKKSVRLTAAGYTLLPVASSLQKGMRQLHDISTHQIQSEIRIGSIDSISEVFLPEIISDLVDSIPDLSINAATLWYYEIYERLEKYELDIGLVSRKLYVKNIKATPLFSERMVFVCRSDSEKYTDVERPKELDSRDEIFMPWDMAYLDWHSKWFQTKPTPLYSLDKFTVIERLLARRDMWVMIPESIAVALRHNPKLMVKRLKNGPPDRVTYLLQRTPHINVMRDRWEEIYPCICSCLKRIASAYGIGLLYDLNGDAGSE